MKIFNVKYINVMVFGQTEWFGGYQVSGGSQVSGSPSNWIHMYLDTEVFGYICIWIPKSGYLCIWIPKYLDTNVSRYLGMKIQRYLDTWVSRYLGIHTCWQIYKLVFFFFFKSKFFGKNALVFWIDRSGSWGCLKKSEF